MSWRIVGLALPLAASLMLRDTDAGEVNLTGLGPHGEPYWVVLTPSSINACQGDCDFDWMALAAAVPGLEDGGHGVDLAHGRASASGDASAADPRAEGTATGGGLIASPGSPVRITLDRFGEQGGGGGSARGQEAAQAAQAEQARLAAAAQEAHRREADADLARREADRRRVEGQFTAAITAITQGIAAREDAELAALVAETAAARAASDVARAGALVQVQGGLGCLSAAAATELVGQRAIEAGLGAAVRASNDTLRAVRAACSVALPASPRPADGALEQPPSPAWTAAPLPLPGAGAGLARAGAYLAAARGALGAGRGEARLLDEAAFVLDAAAGGEPGSAAVAELVEGAEGIVDDAYAAASGRGARSASDAFIRRALAGATSLRAEALPGNRALLAPTGSRGWQDIQAAWRYHDRVATTLANVPNLAPARSWLLDTAAVLLDAADLDAAAATGIDPERTAQARALLDLALDFVPGVSMAKDAVTLATGVNPVTGLPVGMNEQVLIVATLFAPAAMKGLLAHALPHASAVLQRLARRGLPSSAHAARLRQAMRPAEEHLAQIMGVTLCPD